MANVSVVPTGQTEAVPLEDVAAQAISTRVVSSRTEWDPNTGHLVLGLSDGTSIDVGVPPWAPPVLVLNGLGVNLQDDHLLGIDVTGFQMTNSGQLQVHAFVDGVKIDSLSATYQGNGPFQLHLPMLGGATGQDQIVGVGDHTFHLTAANPFSGIVAATSQDWGFNVEAQIAGFRALWTAPRLDLIFQKVTGVTETCNIVMGGQNISSSSLADGLHDLILFYPLTPGRNDITVEGVATGITASIQIDVDPYIGVQLYQGIINNQNIFSIVKGTGIPEVLEAFYDGGTDPVWTSSSDQIDAFGVYELPLVGSPGEVQSLTVKGVTSGVQSAVWTFTVPNP